MGYYRQNKYHNKKVVTAQGTFDSAKEYTRYLELTWMLKAGTITDLQRQVKFEILPKHYVNGKTIRAVFYIADFVYTKDGKQVVEDVKGFKTDVYLLKKKMMSYFNGIEVIEI